MLEEFGWQSLRTDPFVTEDGDAIPAVLFTMGGSGATQVLNLQWPRKTVAEAFRAAGFVDLQWSVFEAVPGSRASRCYAKNPHSVLLTAFLRS